MNLHNSRTFFFLYIEKENATTFEWDDHAIRYVANQTPNHTCARRHTRTGGTTAQRSMTCSKPIACILKAQSKTGAVCERVPSKLRQERGLQGAKGGEGSSCTGSLAAPLRPLRSRLQANSWAQRSELTERHSEIGFSTGRKRLPPNEGRRDRVINVTAAPPTAGSRAELEGSKSARPTQTAYCAEVLGLIASDLNYK